MSRRTYDLTGAARLDLLDIWNYLAEHASIEVADRIAADIDAGLRSVAKTPHRGHRRPDLTSRDILFYRVHSYLLIYRPDMKPIRVLRVLHASRDVGDALVE